MNDLIENDGTTANTPEFTVGELSGQIKKLLEDSFGHVRVKGEIGRVVRAASGHVYFDLKDDKNVIACTSWRGQVARLGMMPEEGLEVVATGKVSGYGPQSRYNMNVERLEIAGVGALMAQLEKRKAAFAAEGLFAPERKKDIPYLPEIIGVITSPQGAVIRDILHRLRDRFPRKVIIWPTAVQGEKCPSDVAAAIEGFNGFGQGGRLPRPDLIIVARGGGSIEDLWGYNDERVVRAVAASEIPIISAVGHETDTTLIDYVSDLRAPTPTAAAEFAVPVRAELWAGLQDLDARRQNAMRAKLDRRAERLRDLSRGLPKPDMLLSQQAQRLDHAGMRLPNALSGLAAKKRSAYGVISGGLRKSLLNQSIKARSERIESYGARFETRIQGVLSQASQTLSAQERLLNGLSHHGTLQRGYAVVRDQDGAVVMRKEKAEQASALEIEFADGRVKVS